MIPPCAASMGCLCAAHARGVSATSECNTTEPSEFLASLPAAVDLNHRDGTPAMAVDAIRRDLKLAVKAGLIPSAAKFSVTRRDYKSISVHLTAWSGAVLVDGFVAVCIESYVAGLDHVSPEASEPFRTRLGRFTRRQSQDGRLTDEINAVMWLVERIADRHNYDNSDYMSDYVNVGYYLHVDADPVMALAQRGIRQEASEAYRALLARAQVAAAQLGPKAVKSICGNGGADNCSDWALDKLIKMAERAAGRPVAYDKKRGAWVVQPRDGSTAYACAAE